MMLSNSIIPQTSAAVILCKAIIFQLAFIHCRLDFEPSEWVTELPTSWNIQIRHVVNTPGAGGNIWLTNILLAWLARQSLQFRSSYRSLIYMHTHQC